MRMTKAFERAAQSSIDESKKTITVKVSDDSIDHDREIIAISAWEKRLPEYLKNPLFCYGHPLGDRNAMPERILGKAADTWIQKDGLWQTLKYAVDLNPLARMCWEMSVADILKSYSVAGEPYDMAFWFDESGKLATLDPKHRKALEEGAADGVMTDVELWETSQVLKGSNRNALKAAMAKGLIKSADLAPLFGRDYPIVRSVAVDFKPETEAKPPDIPETTNSETLTEPPKNEVAPVISGGSTAEAEDPEEAELEAALAADPELVEALVELLSYLV